MERTSQADRLEELLAHRAWVRRVARALVLDESRADDLEQEAWLRALEGPAVRSPKAWLGTVLRNAASNLRRGEMRRRDHEASTPPGSPPPMPAELLERAEVVERVARAVRKMEEPHQTVILLRYFEDLTPPEIAARLGDPVETVRTRLKRALVLLRERLDAEEGGVRRRWVLLLLPLTGPTVPWPPRAVAGGSALATAAGVLAMGTKAKVALAVGILALMGTGVWLGLREPGLRGPGRSAVDAAPVAQDPRSGTRHPAANRNDGPEANPGEAAPSSPRNRALLRGTVTTAEGRALPGVEVVSAEGSVLTDAEGRFLLDLLRTAAESQVVTVRHRGFETQERELRIPPSGDLTEEQITLVPDFVVAGRVEDDGGAPVAGARVFLLLPGSARQESLGTTDANGRFSVTRGESGGFQLRVDAPGPPEKWRSSIHSTVVRSGDRDVVAVLRRRPEGHAMLRAEIVDSGTGDPCTPTRVLVVEATSGLTAPRGLRATMAPGLVTAEGLWTGLWRIWVEVPDRPPAMKEFAVEEGRAEIEVKVEVSARGTLTGRVLFEDMPATELIYVHAINRLALSGGIPSWLRQSDLVGTFPFGSVGREFEFPLAPGEYVVEAYGREGSREGMVAAARALIRVGAGEKVKIDLRMGPVANIRFQGGLVPGWVAELWMAEGNGEFELRDRLVGGGILNMSPSVAPGTYRWRMRFLADDVVSGVREAGETLEGTVTIGAGESKTIPVAAVPKR
jgi:RNA polymerase sigma-70 factor (ECF subfamily)